MKGIFWAGGGQGLSQAELLDERTLQSVARFNPEDVQGPSEVVDPATFEWNDGAWRGRPCPLPPAGPGRGFRVL